MAEPVITIRIRTLGETRGAEAAAAAVEQVTKAEQEAAKAAQTVERATDRAENSIEDLGTAAVTTAAEVREMAKAKTADAAATVAMGEAAEKATPALDGVTESAEKAAGKKGGKGGGGGQGMLQLSQALDDAQYGLRGVLNNIPGLVMTFGLGGGAAGALQIGLIGVSQVLDMISKQSKEMGGPGKPLVPALSFDDAQQKQMEAFIKLLDRQSDALERRNQLLADSAQVMSQQLDYERQMNEILDAREDRDFVSSGDPVADAAEKRRIQQQRLERDAEIRRTGRENNVADADAQATSAAGGLANADRQYQEQKALLEGIQKREVLQARLNDLHKEISRTARDMRGTFADPTRYPGEFLRDMGAIIAGRGDQEELARELTAKMADAAKLQQQLKPGALPGLPGVATTGNAEKDAEQKRALMAAEEERLRELEKRREDALAEAENARRAADNARAQAGRDQSLDDERTSDQRGNIDRSYDNEVNKARKGEAQQEGNASITNAVGGLDQLIGEANDGAFRTKLQELRATLTDSDGATAEDVAAVKAFLDTIKTGNAEVMRIALDTGRETAAAMRSLAQGLEAVRADIVDIRTQNRN